MFKIDKNIPIPPKQRPMTEQKKYPFHEMQIGDSFFIPKNLKYENKHRIKNTRNIRSSVINCLKKYNAKNEPIKISTRTNEHGMRVWRIE